MSAISRLTSYAGQHAAALPQDPDRVEDRFLAVLADAHRIGLNGDELVKCSRHRLHHALQPVDTTAKQEAPCAT